MPLVLQQKLLPQISSMRCIFLSSANRSEIHHTTHTHKGRHIIRCFCARHLVIQRQFAWPYEWSMGAAEERIRACKKWRQLFCCAKAAKVFVLSANSLRSIRRRRRSVDAGLILLLERTPASRDLEALPVVVIKSYLRHECIGISPCDKSNPIQSNQFFVPTFLLLLLLLCPRPDKNVFFHLSSVINVGLCFIGADQQEIT